MSGLRRPPWCPDPQGCSPVIQPLTDSDNRDMANPGYSVTCFGQLAEPIDWTFAGTDHHEDLSDCHYSPLKGVVRWLGNAADWQALHTSYLLALRAVEDGR